MKRIILLQVFFCFTALALRSQPTAGLLRVIRYNDSTPLPALIQKTVVAPADTNKVWSLIKLSSIYWYQGRDNNLDTCLSFARQAHELSTALHFTKGDIEALFLECKALAEKEDMPAAANLLPLVYGEEKVRLLLILAERYINHPNADKSDLPNAFPYASWALRLSDSLASTHWRYECLLLTGKYWFERGDLPKGKATILQIIDDCHRRGDLAMEANYWSELCRYMPRTIDNATAHKQFLRNAWRLFLQAGKKEDGLYALRDLAVEEMINNNFDSARAHFDSVLRLSRQLKIKSTVSTNMDMGSLYLNTGELDKALYYLLQGLDGLSISDQRRRLAICIRLSDVYTQLGDPGKQLFYAKQAIDLCIRVDDPSMYYMTTMVVDAELRQDHPDSALAFVHRFNQEHPALDAEEKEVFYRNLGAIFDYDADYSKAESWYRKMVDTDSATEKEHAGRIFQYVIFESYMAFTQIARFYLHRQDYRQARSFLEKAIADPSSALARDRSEIELLLFRADSALGDFKAAVTHYIKYTTLNDSIFNTRRSRQIEEIQTNYETKQNKDSIHLLESDSQRQHAELEHASLLRNSILGGMALLFLIAALAWRAYAVKRRAVIQLELQKQEINRQNGTLQQLIEEKDLLMSEVHHRVKNNLQIVISLLESQSARLNDDSVQAVLLDGQNRVYAISLLHQKLYRSAAITEVDMSVYIPELADYLADSLDAASRSITITTTICSLKLDVAEALPIGIIVNETVTNAIKYAFPREPAGQINISLQLLDDGSALLEVHDNGIGLLHTTIDNSQSLGMTLIKGLSKQLHGRLTIENDKGLLITLQFKPTPSFLQPVRLR